MNYKAERARALYEAAAKVARNHPKSPYESQAERERSARLARARENMIKEYQESPDKEWSNDYPSYVKVTRDKPDSCLPVALSLFALGAILVKVVVG